MGAAASLKAQLDERKIIVREKKELKNVKKWEKKYTKLEGRLVDEHEHNYTQLRETVPSFRKRVLKARRKLRKAIPSAEVALDDALDTFDYLTDLRQRLVDAAEKSAQSPHGLNPPDDLCEDLLALEGGNPYNAEWKSLNEAVQRSVAGHKAREAQWTQAHIKKCTAWLRKISSLTKKMKINLDIGREGLEIMEEVLAPLGDIEKATAAQLQKLDEELEKAEAVLRRLKQERTTLEEAKEDRLIIEAQRKERLTNIINRSTSLLYLSSRQDGDILTPDSLLSPGRRKIKNTIEKVVLQIRERREVKKMAKEDFRPALFLVDVEGE